MGKVTYPKRNRYYLITVAACMGLAASSTGIFINSVGVFYSSVSTELGVGRGAFALHATICSLTLGFLSPFAARIITKLPLRLLLLVGISLSCIATALMALSDVVWQFYILGLLRGTGMVFFSLMPITTIINNWFHKRHGLVVGLVLSFSGLSGAVFSPLFSRCIQLLGWRQAYLIMAVTAFLLALPGILTLRFTPGELALLPYGDNCQTAGSPRTGDMKDAVRTYLPALILLCCMTVLHTSITGIAQHFPGFAEAAGMGTNLGALMVSASMIGNIITKLAIGFLSDTIGPFRASVCMIALNACSLAALLFCQGNMPFLSLGAAFLYGSVYSVGAVGIPLLTRRLFGQEHYAKNYALMTLFTNIGSATSLTLVGLVYDFTGGYQAALIGGIVIDGINLAILMLLHKINSKKGV